MSVRGGRRQHTVIDLLQHDFEGRLALDIRAVPSRCIAEMDAIVEPVDLVDRHRHVAAGSDADEGERQAARSPPREKLSAFIPLVSRP